MSWELLDHVCRQCLGRILYNTTTTEHRCADCGARAGKGSSVDSLCACGALLTPPKPKKENRADADLPRPAPVQILRCARNYAKSPDFPAEVIAEQVR